MARKESFVNTLLICTLLAAFCFVGCSGDSSDANGEPDASSGGDGDADGDADSDADTDTDTDADTDTDTDSDSDADGDSDDPGEDGGAGDAGDDVASCEVDSDRLFDTVAWLCHEDRGGRRPGKAGNDDALDYVEDVFDSFGFEPAGDQGSFRQKFDYEAWSTTGPATLDVDGETFEYGTGFEIFQYSGGGDIEGDLVFAGYGMVVPPFDVEDYPDCPFDPAGYDDFAGLGDLTGKVALVFRHGPNDDDDTYACPSDPSTCFGPQCQWTFGFKANNARNAGAAAMLLVQDYLHSGDVEQGGGQIGIQNYDENFPVMFADRDKIEAVLPDMQSWADAIDAEYTPNGQLTDVKVKLSVSAGVEDVETDNLIAVIPGTDPEIGDEVVVIGGHIDHMGILPSGDVMTGADDNASGTGVVMELARMIGECDLKPARTIVLAAWNAEEVGLTGSCFYVTNPAFEMENTVAMISVDMVGGGDGTGLALMGGQVASNAWIGDVMRNSAAELGFDGQVVNAPPLDASDHVCFSQAGVPAVLASTLGPHAFFHTLADTIDNILPEDLTVAAELIWSFILPVAMGEEDDYLD